MPVLTINTHSDPPPFASRSCRSSPSTSLFNFGSSADVDSEKQAQLQSYAQSVHAREHIPGTWRYIASNGPGPGVGNRVPPAGSAGIWGKGMGGVVRRRSKVMVLGVLLGLVYAWQVYGSLGQYGHGSWSSHDSPNPVPAPISTPAAGSIAPPESPLAAALSNPLLRWSDTHSSPLFPLLPTWDSPLPSDPPSSHPSTQAILDDSSISRPPPSEEPLHPLGQAADASYNLGPTLLPDLARTLLDFVRFAFPAGVDEEYDRRYGSLRRDQRVYEVGQGEGSWDENKAIWQTDKDAARADSREVGTWKNNGEGWHWELVDDAKAEQWIADALPSTLLQDLWYTLPSGILRSDYLRYLLLATLGGIYTDTDTILLKAPSMWVSDVELFRDGKGWMEKKDIAALVEAENIAEEEERDRAKERVLGPIRAVVGVEADVGDREDWADWWPRPLQIAQWTMATAPLHPIALLALLRVAHNTQTASSWAQSHSSLISSLMDDISISDTSNGHDNDHKQAELDELLRLAKFDPLSEPNQGGPLGVINWTGPSVWTDAVLTYLKARYGVAWTDLRGLRRPVRVGDTVILPVTGFSPGVGNFGAGTVHDRWAMVEHAFRGSWKHEQKH